MLEFQSWPPSGVGTGVGVLTSTTSGDTGERVGIGLTQPDNTNAIKSVIISRYFFTHATFARDVISYGAPYNHTRALSGVASGDK